MSTKKEKEPSAQKTSSKKVKSEKKSKERVVSYPIVGIGASAGGLETLEAFFSTMPPDAGISFVIIQHLSPKHKSIMASLLAKRTQMSVSEITDGTRIELNHVYLNPPGKNVAVFNRTLHLMQPVKSDGIKLPIDFFFKSLSDDQKEKAMGIIVSGTASDGTMGIRVIKGEGGMVMVQDPDTAKYDGMPRSAIETGLVDFVLPVERMPEILIRYVSHPLLKSSGMIDISSTSTQSQLQKIFALIRSASGHDFSHYKPSTIQRRIERRLAIHQIEKLSDYVLYLHQNPAEIEMLFKNLVIGVTSFFRDPETYQVLEKKVFPKLLSGKKPEKPLRFWTVGCSTGEEAYSVAILISEAMADLGKNIQVQIFATDIDPTAIEFARKGIYPDNVAADVSKARLGRFFIKEGRFFQIKKQIRDMIVFSLHNIIKDPPFSRLDLVSCRNLMIYMDSVLQKKIIPLFHYTLVPEGVLFLGTSESIGEFTDFFQPIDARRKIFQRKTSLSEGIVDYPANPTYGGQLKIESDIVSKRQMPMDIQTITEQAILNEYAPSGILVNEKYEIIHFVGQTEKYLVPPTGKPSFNILNMARQGLKQHLTTAIHKAVREKKRVDCKNVPVRFNRGQYFVDISVSPMTGKRFPAGSLLVLFDEKTPEPAESDMPIKGSKGKTQNSEVNVLEQELQSTREYLQATIEELETSNEELKSTNEEMQSVNEELQSTNEELETSKEELQSTNEELATVNSELQNKVDALSKSSDDMHNLLAATEIASLFLDTQLHIQRYTPAAAGIIKLIQTDIGRPLSDLKTSFPEIDLADQAKKVLKDLNTLNMEILSEDMVWYALKIMPYRTTENVNQGVVITVININEVKQAAKVRRLAAVLKDSNDAVTVLDFTGRILAWNKGAENMYGYTKSEALKLNFADLIPKGRTDEISEFADRLKKGDPIKSYKSRRISKDGTIIEIWLTATAMTDEKGQPVEMALTERDLSWLPK